MIDIDYQEESIRGVRSLQFPLSIHVRDRLTQMAECFDLNSRLIQQCLFSEILEIADFWANQHTERRGQKRRSITPKPPAKGTGGGAVVVAATRKGEGYLARLLHSSMTDAAEQLVRVNLEYMDLLTTSDPARRDSKFGIYKDPKIWVEKIKQLDTKVKGGMMRARMYTPANRSHSDLEILSLPDQEDQQTVPRK